MGIAQRIRDVAQDSQGLRDGKLALACESRSEGLSLNQGHGVVQQAAGLSCAEKRNDMGVLEGGREMDLAMEAVGVHAGRELRGKDLDHHLPPQPGLLGYEHTAHPAATQLAHEQVAVGQGGPEVIGEVRQAEDSRGIRCRLLRWSAGGQ